MQALGAPYRVADQGDGAQDAYLSPSIGIALAPRDANDPSELLRLADIAMHHAKAEGGAGWRYYTPSMHEAVLRRIELEGRLREAIGADALELVFQPIHAVRPGLPLVGLEALLRWPQADGSVLSPGVFVPVAEQAGDLIEVLGEWVCRRVAIQRQQWRRQGLGVPLLSVNLSARQFDRAGVAERIRAAFAQGDPATAESSLPLLGIEFEITESVMMRDAQRAETELQCLRALGARVAIDDFGTGYSSLTYLKHLPIDRLKIDRAFVRDLADDDDDAAIVSAAVELAHRLGREAVAEGVECVRQLRLLHAMGCDAVQGYALARPLSALQADAYLRGSGQTHLDALWAQAQAYEPGACFPSDSAGAGTAAAHTDTSNSAT
ncbi:putative bifunctional diguanylate cyclase/phosphodiesterase [Tepidimonas charontis]|uniref:Phytochrome-like protein cph2 n=1 Tax=Tepidimonas charontis TaxID=2267262 RepID=A0A554XHQ4_9BURK|nr:GGDEF domain-containing phosphodiesterase [Tepidimonas charontis]TSE35364.1 Phytochrome-like protein cph2 [Tepidimonas charontis]